VEGFDLATSFDPEVSRRYDDHLRGDEAETVDFLAGLAGGSALELAIGTGRIAIPLTERGVRVDGIELSPDMVARIPDKPDGDKVDVTGGDMASASAPRDQYPLVYLVFNTIYNILTQDGQVRCFENAARHLTTDGVFVVEAAVPSNLPNRSVRHRDSLPPCHRRPLWASKDPCPHELGITVTDDSRHAGGAPARC